MKATSTKLTLIHQEPPHRLQSIELSRRSPDKSTKPSMRVRGSLEVSNDPLFQWLCSLFFVFYSCTQYNSLLGVKCLSEESVWSWCCWNTIRISLQAPPGPSFGFEVNLLHLARRLVHLFDTARDLPLYNMLGETIICALNQEWGSLKERVSVQAAVSFDSFALTNMSINTAFNKTEIRKKRCHDVADEKLHFMLFLGLDFVFLLQKAWTNQQLTKGL